MDFKTYFFIFFKFNNFKIFFEILKTSNIPIVRKMILYSEIILQLEKIVYIWVDYIGLPKGRSFIMIEIYSIISNVILDFIILKIAILVNLIKKVLKINKDIYIITIHKYIDTIYLIIGSSGMFIILTAVSTTISKFLSFV